MKKEKEIEEKSKKVISFLGKKVKIILENKFTYVGVVFQEDENFIGVHDKYDQEISLNKKSISMIMVMEEVNKK
jgi:hypothetical protein